MYCGWHANCKCAEGWLTPARHRSVVTVQSTKTDLEKLLFQRSTAASMPSELWVIFRVQRKTSVRGGFLAENLVNANLSSPLMLSLVRWCLSASSGDKLSPGERVGKDNWKGDFALSVERNIQCLRSCGVIKAGDTFISAISVVWENTGAADYCTDEGGIRKNFRRFKTALFVDPEF